MKLRELEVEHFGVFSGQTLEFDAGFALVYGPNEAGKSTLLQLIRELLFGFKPQQNPYAFDDHAGEMAATAAFDAADGTQLRFRRRKGRKNEVVGTIQSPAGKSNGRDLDARVLGELLGNASKELYEQVFGFSLRELAEADESLKRANLTEALYGGGLGGLANFQKIQAAIQSEAESLFTPRGRSKQQIHQLLGEIKSQGRAVKEETVKPREYEQLSRDVADATAAVEAQRQKLESLRSTQKHLDRLAAAVEPWLRQRDADRELAQLHLPDELPSEIGEQYKSHKRRQNELARDVFDIEQALADEAEQLAALQLAPELVASEAAIRGLEQQIKQIAGFREDMPVRKQQADTIKSGVLAQLRSFSPDWDEHQLERFQSTLAQREQIERLKTELESLERRQVSTTAERSTVTASIKALEKQLERLTVREVPTNLSTLLEQASGYERDVARSLELREQQIETEAKINDQLAKLNAPLDASLDNTAELGIPLAATITEFRDRLRQAEQQVAEAERQAATTKREQAERQEQLAQLDAGAAVPDREQLLSVRQDRDTGWHLVRERVLDPNVNNGKSITQWLTAQAADHKGKDELLTSLTTAYEQAVTAADKIADERQAKAEHAATRDQLTFEIRRLEKRLADDEASIETARGQQAVVVAEWRALWAKCSFTPLSPDAMLQWIDLFDDFVAARSHHKQLLQRSSELQRGIADFESRLAEMFSDAGRSPREQLASARELHKSSGTAAIRRQTYEEQLVQQQETLRNLDEQLAELVSQRNTWQSQWEALLDEFQFPRDWDVHLASKILSGLTAARNDWEKAADLDERVRDMAEGLASFESAVRSLCERLASDLTDFVPEHAMSELQSRLEAAKSAQQVLKNLETSRAKLQKQQAARKEQLAAVELEIKRLFALADAEDEAQFEQVADGAKRRAELREQRREAISQIHLIRGTEDEATFLAELQEADADIIASQQQRNAEELANEQRAYDACVQEATRLEDNRGKHDGASRAADLAFDLESTRGRLAAAVDRWAPLMLAQAVMKQAIKKFEREHQPAMLAEVERLLQRMTLGRYTAIERKLDEHGTLLVVDDGGARKEPHQLSTGTREQLYLAIRLAYILHYCRDSEPLPIVMDDVLVNFDAERAKQTLRVLTEVADHVQIIFLTCHQHMVELVRCELPACRPIILPGGNLAEGTITAARTLKRTSATTAS